MIEKVILGTRRSKLALRQCELISEAMKSISPSTIVELKHIIARGDEGQSAAEGMPPKGLKGLWTIEIEDEVANGFVDAAMHCLKDLPTEMNSQLCLEGFPKRAAPWDVLVSKQGEGFWELQSGAVIGTSSVRRFAQLRRLREDLIIKPIRGNIDTRLRKLHDSAEGLDAIVLAQAGLDRLGMEKYISYVFSEDEMLPAAGQGSMVLQCRKADEPLRQFLRSITDNDTFTTVRAERAFIDTLGAGCHTPVAAHAVISQGQVTLRTRSFSYDEKECIEVIGTAPAENAETLGRSLAQETIKKGFRALQFKNE